MCEGRVCGVCEGRVCEGFGGSLHCGWGRQEEVGISNKWVDRKGVRGKDGIM